MSSSRQATRPRLRLASYSAAWGMVLAAVCTAQAQTMTVWHAADNPHVIANTVVVPATTVVMLEAGVVVQMQAGSTLQVLGELVGVGTATDPILVNGGTDAKLLVGGRVDLEGAQLSCTVEPADSGRMTFTDSTFNLPGSITTVGAPFYVWNTRPFLALDGCQLNGVETRLQKCTVSLRNTQITGAYCELGSGYVRIDGLTVINSPYEGLHLYDLRGEVLLDGLSVAGAAGAGVFIESGNYLFAANTQLQSNLYPVHLNDAGILPGSTLPATGNTNDFVDVPNDGDRGARVVWSAVGIPYVVRGAYVIFGGTLRFDPGADVRLGPGASIWQDFGRIEVRGTPTSPVTFSRFVPASPWQGLQFFSWMEHCVVDGGEIGVRQHSASGPGYVADCIIQNCAYGLQNNAVVRKTRFLGNQTGAWNNSWPLGLSGDGGGNSFVGNGVGVTRISGPVDASSNWWGSASGPTAPTNPGGTGDATQGVVSFTPYLVAEPDYTDHLPVVRLAALPALLEPGSTVFLSWTSEDDQALVGHRVEFFDPVQQTTTVVADGLSGDTRSFEWQVPDIGFVSSGTNPAIRVVATDSSGQEGRDEHWITIITHNFSGTLTFATPLAPSYRAGDNVGALCWTPQAVDTLAANGIDAYVVEDDVQRWQSLGGVTTYLTCLSLGLDLPFVSTDSARVVLILRSSLNRMKFFVSEPFGIRPDSLLGDAPPTVSLLVPTAGAAYVGGSTVPVSWSATDDEGIRSVALQVSLDGGRTWQDIVRDLPGTTTTYGWQVPESLGQSNVRLRVVVADMRFQRSSAGADRSFSIVQGTASSSLVRGDCNVDGGRNIGDVVFFLGVLFPTPGAPNLAPCSDSCDGNDNGSLEIGDAVTMLAALFGTPSTPLPAPNVCAVDPTADSLDCGQFTGCP